MNPITSSPGEEPVRLDLSLLLNPRFGAMFWGKLVSSTGLWIHGIAAGLVVYGVQGSSAAVATVTMAQFLPQLLAPISGVWSDRGWERAQLIGGRLLCAFGSTVCGAAVLLDVDDGLKVTATVAGTFVVGLGFALGGPAQQSVMIDVVSEAQRSSAIALNTVPMTLARVVGPAAGSIVATYGSGGAAFVVAAACHLWFTIVLVVVRVDRPVRPHMAGQSSLRYAVSYVRCHRPLLLALVAVVAIGAGTEPTLTLAPALADQYGTSSRYVTALSIAFGVGAGVGLAALAARPHPRSRPGLTSSGLAAAAAGLGVSAVFDHPWLPLLGFGLIGAGFTATVTAATSLVQAQAPSALRGRILALWLVGFVGVRPPVAGALGWIADVATPRSALALTALLVALAALVCRPQHLRTDQGTKHNCHAVSAGSAPSESTLEGPS